VVDKSREKSTDFTSDLFIFLQHLGVESNRLHERAGGALRAGDWQNPGRGTQTISNPRQIQALHPPDRHIVNVRVAYVCSNLLRALVAVANEATAKRFASFRAVRHYHRFSCLACAHRGRIGPSDPNATYNVLF
jgi:hypothetical protein